MDGFRCVGENAPAYEKTDLTDFMKLHTQEHAKEHTRGHMQEHAKEHTRGHMQEHAKEHMKKNTKEPIEGYSMALVEAR